MKIAYAWAAIGFIVLASTTGDVLLSRAMKQVGDVGRLYRASGLMTCALPSWLRTSTPHGKLSNTRVRYPRIRAFSSRLRSSSEFVFCSSLCRRVTSACNCVYDRSKEPAA